MKKIKENMNYSIQLTILFLMFIIGTTMINLEFVNKNFISYDDVKDDLTGNYAIDKQIVRDAGEINFTIMFVLSMAMAGLLITGFIYSIRIAFECKWSVCVFGGIGIGATVSTLVALVIDMIRN